MEEDEIALDKALESGDSDLVFFVLLHLKAKLPLSSFFRVINARPTATALIEASAQADDAELLKDLYYQDDRRLDGAHVFVREALRQPDVRGTLDQLALAAKLLSDSKEMVFELKALQETAQLLRVQERYSTELSEDFAGLSVNAFLYKLIQLGYLPRAKKVVAEFKVGEKTWWWVRLRALVARRDWGELEEIARVRKSPIGWEPFFNAVIGAGNLKLAAVFVPKCTSGDKVVMWEKCGMRVKAAEEAVRNKDEAALERLRAAAGVGTVEGREIDRLVSGLKR